MSPNTNQPNTDGAALREQLEAYARVTLGAGRRTNRHNIASRNGDDDDGNGTYGIPGPDVTSRDELAQHLYDLVQKTLWAPTVDGGPNTAAYALADLFARRDVDRDNRLAAETLDAIAVEIEACVGCLALNERQQECPLHGDEAACYFGPAHAAVARRRAAAHREGRG